jgi:uncharacterized DUF497 family protein
MTEFEWDPEKAPSNRANHRVPFEEARTIFGDVFELAFADPDHSEGEQRFFCIGESELGRLLVVAYTEWVPNKIRIISPRRQRSGNMSQDTESSEMRPEYGFSEGVRGKRYEAYRESTNVVLLDSDIARVFRDSASVNRALRLLLDLANKEAAARK